MFPILKNSVLYFSVLSYTYALPTHDDETKILDSKELAKKEIAPIMDHFHTIMDTVDEKAKLLLQGEFLGELMALGRKAVRDARRVARLNFEKGRLDKEKERGDLYRVLLGIGHRVDQLEEILSAGSDIVLGGEREKRWIQILKLNTPIVTEFRNKIIEAGLDTNLFAKNVQQICQERAGHGDVSMPEVLKENSIPELLKLMKIPKDENTVITIRLLLDTLKLPPAISPEPVPK